MNTPFIDHKGTRFASLKQFSFPCTRMSVFLDDSAIPTFQFFYFWN